MLHLGDIAPDFTAGSTHGPINWHNYLDNWWGILFSHPADFTAVCTSELGKVACMESDFKDRRVKVAAYSCDNLESHKWWSGHVEQYAKQELGCSSNGKLWFPIIGGDERKVATLYGMVDKLTELRDKEGLPHTVRSTFIIAPDKKIQCIMTYPLYTGRNFNEIIRVIDSLQLAPSHGLATPQNWQRGSRAMILPNVSDEEAKERFGEDAIEINKKFPYIKMTAVPGWQFTKNKSDTQSISGRSITNSEYSKSIQQSETCSLTSRAFDNLSLREQK